MLFFAAIISLLYLAGSDYEVRDTKNFMSKNEKQ